MQFTNFLLDYTFLSKLGFFNSKCNSNSRYSQIPVIVSPPTHGQVHGHTQRCNFPFYLGKFRPKNHNR